MNGKIPSESYVIMTNLVLPNDTNTFNNLMGGRLLHWMDIAAAITAQWGSFAAFQTAFNDKAVNNFGSSWTWLVKKADGSLDIVNTSNAGTPLTDTSLTPVMTVDLWEHAYYIDFRNARPTYLNAFWALINWEFAAQNFAA